jgi:bla regulator protein blaR1
LSGFAGRETHDHTDLRGNFDLNLDWSDDISIFTAIEEQLGLKLVPTRGPVDVIVVAHVERSTSD